MCAYIYFFSIHLYIFTSMLFSLSYIYIYTHTHTHTLIHGAFNKSTVFFLLFFLQAFKIVVDSLKFTMLLLYIL